MLKFKSTLFLFLMMAAMLLQGQTLIPNAGFEDWTNFGNYSNPTGWDTPNTELMSIPFFGTAVVTKSTDHHGTGSFSAKLESKHITLPPLDAPGFMITANFTLDIATMTYTITGGVPISDRPTHLKGYYKYIPKGGDSCLIGIGLFKTAGGIRDTIGHAEFSTKTSVPDWTYFSSWIDYDTIVTPDTMQVYAFSTAQDAPTPGTVLYVDDLYLDYTVGINKNDPAAGIHVYDDRETGRLMIFFDFAEPQIASIRLIGMTGKTFSTVGAISVKNDRSTISYHELRTGIYVLEIVHDNKIFSKKFFLNN